MGDRKGKQRAPSEEELERCAICLSPQIINQTRISPCQHEEFCFACISTWSNQSRRCPLCLGDIEKLIHNIRSETDYQVYHLHSLSNHSQPSTSSSNSTYDAFGQSTTRPRRSFAQKEKLNWREREEERALERRAYIYSQNLFSKHIASNRYTGFKPITPESFASDGKLKARVIKFVRRELQTFGNIDISFLTTYTLSIFSQMDLRSTPAIRLLSDFLSEEDAIHFAHEVILFARSPFETLEGFDRVVQYSRPEVAVGKNEGSGNRRKSSTKIQLLPLENKKCRSPPPSRQRSPSRSRSRSPIRDHISSPQSVRSKTRSNSPLQHSPIRSITPRSESVPPIAPPVNISIFGLAARLGPPPSATAIPIPVVQETTKLDLAARLQSRLLNEYRTASAAKSKVSTLQTKLQLKLKAEKEVGINQKVVFTDELREMLMARLEEEKGTFEEMDEDWVGESIEEEQDLRSLLVRKLERERLEAERIKIEKEKIMRDKLKEKILKEKLLKR